MCGTAVHIEASAPDDKGFGAGCAELQLTYRTSQLQVAFL